MSDSAKWEIASSLRDRARDDFFALLDQITGRKDLFLDADLFPLIDLTSNATEIRQHNVGNLHKLESINNAQTKNACVFFLRPNLMRFLNLAKQLRQLNIRDAHIVCVPRKFHAFEHLLEQEGLFGRCKLYELTSFDMIPVDYDVFSMVNSHLYLSVYLDRSTDWLSTISASLIDFQQLFGRFSTTISFGKLGSQVARQIEREQQRLQNIEPAVFGKQIQTVILFDRSVDVLTPFCSQMCYEGLLDEYFNVEGSRLKLPKKDGQNENAAKQFDHVSISTKDDVIIEGIRAMHFSKVFQKIKGKFRIFRKPKKNNRIIMFVYAALLAHLNSSQSSFRDQMQDASIGDLKLLVNTNVKEHLNAKKQVTRHLDLCTDIFEKKTASDFKVQLEIESNILHSENSDDVFSYIHTMICRCEPNKYRVLQLLCLFSTANNGLNKDMYETLCRSFLQVYGYENIPLLYKLEQLNYFHVKRTCDVPISTNAIPAASRGEALLKKGKIVAQNLTEKAQMQKTFFQFLKKRLNLTPEQNQQARATPVPDMVKLLLSICQSKNYVFLLISG